MGKIQMLYDKNLTALIGNTSWTNYEEAQRRHSYYIRGGQGRFFFSALVVLSALLKGKETFSNYYLCFHALTLFPVFSVCNSKRSPHDITADHYLNSPAHLHWRTSPVPDFLKNKTLCLFLIIIDQVDSPAVNT